MIRKYGIIIFCVCLTLGGPQVEPMKAFLQLFYQFSRESQRVAVTDCRSRRSLEAIEKSETTLDVRGPETSYLVGTLLLFGSVECIYMFDCCCSRRLFCQSGARVRLAPAPPHLTSLLSPRAFKWSWMLAFVPVFTSSFLRKQLRTK